MENTFYLLDRLYRLSGVPVRYLDKQGDFTLFTRGYTSETDPVLLDASLRNRLMTICQYDKPFIDYEEDEIAYGVCQDNLNHYAIIGPVDIGLKEPNALNKYMRLHKIESASFFIKAIHVDLLCTCLSLAAYAITGTQYSELEIISNQYNSSSDKLPKPIENEFQNYILENTEQEYNRFSHEDEIKFLLAIQNGDTAAIKARTDVSAIDRVGKLAQNKFKHYEYLCCATITLSSRAAIVGGLDATSAYAMSDLFKQRLEKCEQLNEIMHLYREVMISFAERVKKSREERSRSSYIEKTKDYINKHLNKQFDLDDLAESAGVNKSYLSRRFSEVEGIGIQKYARNRRIEAAANMLKYSDEDISTIANYLCFPSQSYFGKVFKEIYNITPQKYRDREKSIDFSL